MTELTTQDEEQLLIGHLLSARGRLERIKEVVSKLRMDKITAENEVAIMEQAIADYCDGNGLKSFDSGNTRVIMGSSHSVDCPDISAVPSAYIRTKTVEEVDKQAIRAEMPQGNWYTVSKKPKITLRGLA